MSRKIILSILAIGLLASVSCNKVSDWDEEMTKLDEYLLENNITAEPTYSGIYYIETLAGSGVPADGGDRVRVKYSGTFLNGNEFDSGEFEFTIGIGQVIRGWDEGINYMKEGGKAILIIPSNMAYGSSGSQSIPGYTTLLFEVELLDVY
ncbi:MAG: peptidylprolyl isomerase [Bacteroidetes bacterium]|jgi:FKBP-type peptidyl-prolyl cis-trans isomerase|nr:peptidylprolyl isomerase [Bacteroidota bacterium]MBT4401841.1 peptidylprolyl isomerase [Bacteroidota bacterium]MBT5425540.1 peptidylprolyl isomerase [Bacteroidota bacterium]MBT7094365.1 peptidylprolyl isomerase [Bacteroidota bacterium]MBT7462895.1 peptidylprolyl isomerase [Bacteroidota bacterium]